MLLILTLLLLSPVICAPLRPRQLDAVLGAKVQTMAQLSMAAYGTPQDCEGVISGTKIVSEFKSPLGQEGFIASVPALKTVAIVFTGTNSAANLRTDTQTNPVALNFTSCGVQCQAHEGAVANYLDAKKETNDFAAAFSAMQAGDTLTITGHSLGGAVASIGAIDMVEQATGGVLTYGEFRGLNGAAAAFLDDSFGVNAQRIVHNRDNVPAFSVAAQDPTHHGQASNLRGTTLDTLEACAQADDAACSGGARFGGVINRDHLTYFSRLGSCGSVDPTAGLRRKPRSSRSHRGLGW